MMSIGHQAIYSLTIKSFTSIKPDAFLRLSLRLLALDLIRILLNDKLEKQVVY